MLMMVIVVAKMVVMDDEIQMFIHFSGGVYVAGQIQTSSNKVEHRKETIGEDN